MRPFRRPARGRLVACVLVGLTLVGLTAAGIVRRDADAQRFDRTAQSLEDMLVYVKEQSAVEWMAMAERAAGSVAVTRSYQLRHEMYTTLGTLERSGSAPAEIAGVRAQADAFYAALQRQFQLLGGHHVEAAFEHDEEAVDPTLETLTESLEGATALSRSRAGQAALTAKLQSLGLLLACFALLAVMTWRQSRVSHRTELKVRDEAALRRSEERFRGLVEHSTDMITLVAGDGTVLMQSQAIEKILGIASDDVLRRPLPELLHPDDHPRLERLQGAATSPADRTIEWRMRHRDGHWVHVETTVGRLSDGTDTIVLTTRDASARKALEEQLRHRAFHDPLTQLPNRALFFDRVGHALTRDHVGRQAAVLFLDLDDFKLVNDGLGHSAGDELLVGVAKRLRGSVRSADTAARLGGDEFGVLLESVAGVGEAVQAAQRLLDAFQEPFTLHGEPLQVRLSIGVALGVLGHTEPDDLLRHADLAMYAAKHGGKHRYEVYDPSAADAPTPDHVENPDRITWFMRSEEYREEILSVLDRPDGIVPAFQPIVDLSSGTVAGFEMLARFPHGPKRPPNAWFAQAHRCGLGAQLEFKAVEAGLAQGGRPAGTYLSLNLSPSVIASGEAEALLPEDLDGIVIEVTENELITEGEQLLASMQVLRARGARIAVDDAGSGYASLKQLTHLRPEMIKLDRSIVSDVDSDSAKVALIESFVRFAHRTGATVVAEGVETLAELITLADLDVGYAQGYGLARPGAPWPEVAADATSTCLERTRQALHHPDDWLDSTAGDCTLERVSGALAAARTATELGAATALIATMLEADEVAFSELRDELEDPFLAVRSEHDWAMADRRCYLRDHPLAERVLRLREASQVLVGDAEADPSALALLHEAGHASLLMIPVLSQDRPLGLLEIYKGEDRAWSRLQISRARVIAHQLGAVLSSFERVPERRLRLELPARAA